MKVRDAIFGKNMIRNCIASELNYFRLSELEICRLKWFFSHFCGWYVLRSQRHHLSLHSILTSEKMDTWPNSETSRSWASKVRDDDLTLCGSHKPLASAVRSKSINWRISSGRCRSNAQFIFIFDLLLINLWFVEHAYRVLVPLPISKNNFHDRIPVSDRISLSGIAESTRRCQTVCLAITWLFFLCKIQLRFGFGLWFISFRSVRHYYYANSQLTEMLRLLTIIIGWTANPISRTHSKLPLQSQLHHVFNLRSAIHSRFSSQWLTRARAHRFFSRNHNAPKCTIHVFLPKSPLIASC